MFVHSADKLAKMRTKFHIIQAKLIMSVWCFTVQCQHRGGRLVTCRLVCRLPPAQEQLRVPQMARSSHSDTEVEEPTQLAVSSYLATGGSSWATAKQVLCY